MLREESQREKGGEEEGAESFLPLRKRSQSKEETL